MEDVVNVWSFSMKAYIRTNNDPKRPKDGYCCQPIRWQVWKSLLTNMDFNIEIS